jgi:type II secretory pathway component PulJ
MEQIESITEYLKRRLRDAGAARFEAIADEASVLAGIPLDHEDRVRAGFIRKFVYGSRENPRIGTIQPLLDYFAAVDRGERRLPEADEKARAA